jgi:transcriptional regulator with XRE-family HTH domain
MPHPVDVHVGLRIKTRRMLVGMSQANLGQAAGISFQQVQKYERGTDRISASRLYEFARCLGVQPAYFFDGLPIAVPADNKASTIPTDRETLRLLRGFLRIGSPALRRQALALVTAMGQHYPHPR